MKQILLLLLLLPCFAMAQYQGNANQKITLGEQTTADGLVYRGVLADTALITPRSDTSAYIILDTVNNKFYNYNRSTNVWSLAGGGVSVTSFSAGTTGLTPSTATTGAVTLGGTLAVANGGTGASTAFTTGSVVFAGESGTYTQDNSNLFFNNATKRLGIGTASPTALLDISSNNTSDRLSSTIFTNGTTGSNIRLKHARGTLASPSTIQNADDLGQFIFQGYDGTDFLNGAQIKSVIDNTVSTGNMPGSIAFLTNQGVTRMTIGSNGNVKILSLAATGTRTVLADVNGVLSAPISSINYKENVQPLDYGLNEILQINPISFDYINKDKWGEDRNLGFIVEDIYTIIPEVTGTIENDAMYLDMVKLIPILTKAIQEQQALIKALEQRILILENK